MKSASLNIGCPSTPSTREWTTRSSVSRGPKLPSVRGRKARSASVIGAPITQKNGTTIISIMCWSMWVLKCSRP